MMRARPDRTTLVVLLVALAATIPASAQQVSGTAFEDRDADGIHDAGEPPIEGVDVLLYGQSDATGPVDETDPTDASGAYTFAPGNGCYLLLAQDPPGWRMTASRFDRFPETAPGYSFPVGQPRFEKIDGGQANLRAGALRYTAMGDSIAYNWNSCFFPESFWYAKQIRSRLQCAAPAAAVTLDEAAVKGEHTDDLLVDDTADLNNIFRVLEIQPELVTISMIGNDLLDVDVDNPNQTETNRAVAEILDARQNLQEVLSTLAWDTSADVALNTLYDNLAYNCYGGTTTSSFHRTWLPIINRMLRDLAWGQSRRLSINEVAAEFGQEDQNGACTGYDDQICRGLFDGIHPNNNGFTVIREKVWEGIGGVNLGARDAIGRTTVADADYGFLRRVRRLHPTTWETAGGATAANPEAALDGDDGGAAASITLGVADEEFRLAGFPDWYDEIRIVRAVAGVTYRTTGSVVDDFYRMEASPAGEFRPPPGYDYTPTNWNFYTPLVGGGGPNQPPENPDYGSARILAVPEVATNREASSTLTKNPELPGGAGEYVWPAITHDDLATAAVRVASAPQAGTPGNETWTVELDAAWIDLYGWEEPRPDEITGVAVARLSDGTLEVSFDSAPDAQRYNLYWGLLETVRSGQYDHGGDAALAPDCDAATVDVGGGRLRIDVVPGSQPSASAYFLISDHVADVESPTGFRSDAEEIDRSQSTCR